MECNDGKLFVGGLSKKTSKETLKQHFSRYGPVKECIIIKNWNDSGSRGFGFVKFDQPSHAHQALECRNPTIDGKSVEVKPATEMRSHTLKIFVGGLAYNLTDQDFKNYFEEFGKVEEAIVMHDKRTGVPRGFGFITFDSEVAVDNVLQKDFHELGNKRVEIKRAIPKSTRYSIYDANKTEMELGFGRDGSMLSNGSGCDLPWLYYDSEGNRYYIRGSHYYYCPCPNPLPSCTYAAPHVYGSNMSPGRWAHADHVNYFSQVYTNGGIDGNVGNEVRADHADFGPKDSSRDLSSRSKGSDDSKETEVLFMESNGLDNHITESNELDNHNVCSRSKGNDDSKEAKVVFMDSNGLDNHITESNELDNHNVCSRSKGNDDSKEAKVVFMDSNGLDNHITESNGLDNHNVCSRSKGNDDSNEAEVLFMEINGLDNHITESNGLNNHNVCSRSKGNDDSKEAEVFIESNGLDNHFTESNGLDNQNVYSRSQGNDDSKLFMESNGFDNHITESNGLDNYNVSSRSKGNYDNKKAEVLFMESNGLDNHITKSNGFNNHNGPTGEGQYAPSRS